MGLFNIFAGMFRRRISPPQLSAKTPLQVATEEARVNNAFRKNKGAVVIASPQLSQKIQAQVRAKEAQLASAKARRIAKYNVRR